jgi:polyhydroxyalkanoate synthesis regulator phasin
MADSHSGMHGDPSSPHSHETSESSERVREAIRDGFTIMVGAASWAFEQGDRLLDNWLQQGKESREQGRRRFDDFTDRARRAGDDFSRRVQDSMRSARSSMPLATREQVANLERQVAELNRQIEALRGQTGTSSPRSGPPSSVDRPV